MSNWISETELIMENSCWSGVPSEIFELICSHLSFCDIANLELSSTMLRRKIEESRVWRKQAERFNRKFKYKFIEQMLDYTKHNDVNRKYIKIIIGEFPLDGTFYISI